jgi:nitrate/TMAO reductase-like tetraheme cytochrome c subunit
VKNSSAPHRFIDNSLNPLRETGHAEREPHNFLIAQETKENQLTKDAADDLLIEEPKDDLLTDETADDLLVDEPKDDLLTDETADDLLVDEPKDDLLTDEAADELSVDTEEKISDSTPEEDSDSTIVTARKSHEKVFAGDKYPSSEQCKICHEDHYREWSVSPHAYAQMSPVFNAMHGTIVKLTNGTNGDFCIRCHTQVGMNLGEPIFMSNIDRHPTSREGITCIVCHRVNKAYGKESGRLHIVEGDLYDPVYGPKGNEELSRVLQSDEYLVTADRNKRGRGIHAKIEKFFELTQPSFCGSCHDVNLLNGFRLEEAFSEYKTSPAAKKGITCQDCHMGTIPGVPSPYAIAPAAKIGDVPTKPRKRTNHMFPGPDHSVIHPGIFPHQAKAAKLATIREWLTFDYKANWGTDEFEDKVTDDYKFPERWATADDRYDAREILNEQFKLLDEYYEQRKLVLQAGFKLGEIVTQQADKNGIQFKVEVRNGTDGHGVPTGFDAERLVFLKVTVTDPLGTTIYQSGDPDPNGDLRDSHSLYVHNGELPEDKDLFNLQTKFITRNQRGSEREEVLAVNRSETPLPFLRPLTLSNVLLGRPIGARKHKQNIEPNGRRWGTYTVDGSLLNGPGKYKAKIELIVGMVPVNLINDIKGVGFDYGMSPRDVAEGVLAGHVVLWDRQVSFDIP